jgi:hypothetical protein
LLSQPGSRKAAGLLAVRSKPKDSGERAAQFNQQLTVFRDQADFLDQPAKRLSGLRPEFRPVQFLVQALNPLTVQVRELRVKPGCRRRSLLQLRPELLLASLECNQLFRGEFLDSSGSIRWVFSPQRTLVSARLRKSTKASNNEDGLSCW